MKTIKQINIKLGDEKSILKGVRQKTKLENEGYIFIAEDVGFTEATLFYKKEVR